MKKIIAMFLTAVLVLSSCGSMSKTAGGSLVGTGAGAAIGAGIGALFGGGKGAAIGAAVGGAVGAGTGAIIGHKMDKKAEELKALENAQIEKTKDANGLEAIKVTFESGILFPTNGIKLNTAAKKELKEFAEKMADMPDTDITIFGHTDNTGSAEVNERISGQRAEAVAAWLSGNGIDRARMKVEGKSYTMPVADNATAEGKAKNRRVEVFISANENMIKAAEAEAKK